MATYSYFFGFLLSPHRLHTTWKHFRVTITALRVYTAFPVYRVWAPPGFFNQQATNTFCRHPHHQQSKAECRRYQPQSGLAAPALHGLQLAAIILIDWRLNWLDRVYVRRKSNWTFEENRKKTRTTNGSVLSGKRNEPRQIIISYISSADEVALIEVKTALPLCI